MSIRLIKSVLHHIKNRSAYKLPESQLRKIKKIDNYNFRNKISQENNLLNNLMDKGYFHDNSFFSKDLNQKLYALIPKKVKTNPGFNTFEIPNEIKKNIVNELDMKMKKDLTQYLNDEPFYYRIELKITISDSSAPTVSSFWHYDLVGKRLKLFYYLDSSLSKINTYLIEKTHNSLKPSDYISSRIYSYFVFLINFFSKRIKTISPIKDTFFLFDTNIFHKGGLVTKDNSFRTTLQCDIISKKKYNLLYKYGDKLGL